MHPTPRLAAALLAGSGLGRRCSPRPTWSRTATPASHCATSTSTATSARAARATTPTNGRRASSCAWSPASAQAPSASASTPSACSASSSTPAAAAAEPAAAGRRLRRGSQDDYAKLGLTAKARVSNSLLKVGALHFKSPLVSANDTRLLPELFRGALLDVQEIDA